MFLILPPDLNNSILNYCLANVTKQEHPISGLPAFLVYCVTSPIAGSCEVHQRYLTKCVLQR